MSERQFKDLDYVELASDIGRWPAGTRGTIVDPYPDAAMVEISDDLGRWLDFLTVPYSELRHVRPVVQRRVAP